jgi:hypothetical protein
VPAPEPSTLQASAPSHRTTRATQKVQEAELTWSKSKGKVKVKVIKELCKEVQREELEKLKAKRVVIQDSGDDRQPRGVIFHHLFLCLFSCFFVTALYYVFLVDFLFCYMRDESTGREVKEIERNRPFSYNTMFLGAFSSGSLSL